MPVKIDATGGAVSMFGNGYFSNIGSFGCVWVVIFVSVKKHNDVGILLNTTLITQAGEHGVFVLTLFNGATKLGGGEYGNV